jgi:hypothetical protein
MPVFATNYTVAQTQVEVDSDAYHVYESSNGYTSSDQDQGLFGHNSIFLK